MSVIPSSIRQADIAKEMRRGKEFPGKARKNHAAGAPCAVNRVS